MKRFLKTALLFLALLFVFLLARTFLAKSKQLQVTPAAHIYLEEKLLTQHFADALKIQTISYDEPQKVNSAEFDRFHNFLRQTFPHVHEQLTLERVEGESLLYRWQGRDMNLPPLVLMAHQDVVPVEPTAWKHSPFSGDVADGYIWGRGALDDKCNVVSQMESVEYLLKKNFQPKRTVYLSFGHDEEAGGRGTRAIVDLLNSRGVHPEMVIDEGGAILDQIIPGLVQPTAMIGTSEKGYVTLELTIDGAGGHSSVPPKHATIGLLAEAIRKLEGHPMPARLHGSMVQMLDSMGPELPFASRFFVVNRWLFQPLILIGMTRHGATNATIRTTTAVTMMDAGVKENVLPSHARAVVNFRIRPGETTEDVIRHVRETIHNDSIQIVKRPQGMDPSPVSPDDSREFQILNRTIREIYPTVKVLPGIVIGATDARYYAKISRNVYRFSPFAVTLEDFETVHGTNERIRVENYIQMIRFYVQLLRNAASA